MAFVKIDNLSFSYPNEAQQVLNNIDLQFEQGEFVVLIGQSGCGKTTLLRHLKRELKPHGETTGAIFYKQQLLDELSDEEAAAQIGYVLQNPDNQLVTDKVWHELAFGLENFGLDSLTIRRRVAEMANFFGIHKWFHQKTTELSGGQKQLLNLAAIMVMQPKLLLLDEPTSQLDPIAATEFIQTLRRLNEELGLTIIMIEHRLEEVLPIADRVIALDKGAVIYDGQPNELLHSIDKNHPLITALPAATKIFHLLNGQGQAPLTIREGQKWLTQNFTLDVNTLPLQHQNDSSNEIVLQATDVAFRYEKNGEDIVKHFNITVHKGEFLTMIGGNGTGKSTALSLLAGLQKPYRGEILVFHKTYKQMKKRLHEPLIALLPQDPKTLFVHKTVQHELDDVAKVFKKDAATMQQLVSALKLHGLLTRHPYDLSGGEQQRLALAKLLMMQPQILLLDEPTKGLDAFAKEELASILQQLQRQGITIVMVTHDIEFSAKHSSRCALFFDGNLVSEDPPNQFYCGNNFYTTAAHRISRNIIGEAITCEDVVALCQKISV